MKKKYITALLTGLGLTALSALAAIPSALKGNYRLISGYTTGSERGLFAYGTATFFSNGKVSYTDYYPYINVSTSGQGTVSEKGEFSFSNGVKGRAQIYSNRIGYGTYSDSVGSGYFCVSK